MLGFLLTAQHALAAAPTEINDAPTLRLSVSGGSYSATTVDGVNLDTRLFLFEHYALGLGPWTGWNDSNTATGSYTITLTDHLRRATVTAMTGSRR